MKYAFGEDPCAADPSELSCMDEPCVGWFTVDYVIIVGTMLRKYVNLMAA